MEEGALSKVFDRRFKHADVVLAGDVLVQAGTDALAVTHFAEDPAVGGGDALDGVQRAVGVEVNVSGGVALQVNVLGGDLAVGRQLTDQLFGCKELALAVGNGDIVHVAHVGQRQPGGLVGGDPGADDTALVAGDVVEGQGGAGLVGVDDLAVGNQTQLDQRLEAVADAAYQAVPLLQKGGDALLDGGVAEERGDKLAGAVRRAAAER